ncbi:MAG TPA: DUF2339 domain-containing protein [Kofleriaceae bacterium]|nr:DUF2339 domain-containing protein [Kofleriaceae bacterium]
MDDLQYGLYALVGVGSFCGLQAARRLGTLTYRVAQLEQRLGISQQAPAPSGLPLGAAREAPHALDAGIAPVARSVEPSFASARPASEPSFAPARPAAEPRLTPAVSAPLAVEPAAIAPVASPLVPVASPAAVASPALAVSPAVAASTVSAVSAAAARASAAARAAAAARSSEADWWHRFELQAGTRWVTWLGAGALVIAAALFVKLAIDRGWLGPEARLALGAAGGIGLLLAGRRAHRAEMRPLSQGLFGAGLGVLYVSTYVAFASYGLIARELVFAAMIGVTVTGCAIALRHDAQPVAVLALLGGLLTPVAVSSGGGSLAALCSYLLVLDAGALAIALARRWAALELLALAGTWALFGGWLARAHDAAARPAELAWLAVLHLMFVAVPLGDRLRRRVALAPGRAPGRALLTAANAGTALVAAAAICDGDRRTLGIVVLAMAALYTALEALSRWRSASARGELELVGLAAALATLAVPLLLRDRAVTLAWSLEAPALLALGFRDRLRALRVGASGVLALALLHGLATGWPLLAAGSRAFANPAFASALIAPLAALLFAAVHHARRDRGDEGDRWYAAAALLAGIAAILALVHHELARYFALAGRRDLGDAAVPLVWAIGSLLGLAACARRSPAPAGLDKASALAALIAAGLCVIAYRAPGHPDALLALNLRFVAAAVTAAAAAASAAMIGRRDPEQGRLAWITAIVGFGLAIGAEAYLHYAAVDPFAHAGRRAHTALSIAWSGYAAVLLAIGFVRRRRAFRLAGLALLGLVAVKLLLIDLAGAAQAYRVLSFLVVGALMIAVSYAYHRLERRPGPPEA